MNKLFAHEFLLDGLKRILSGLTPEQREVYNQWERDRSWDLGFEDTAGDSKLAKEARKALQAKASALQDLANGISELQNIRADAASWRSFRRAVADVVGIFK